MKRMYLDVDDFDVAYQTAKNVTEVNKLIEIKSIVYGRINRTDCCVRYGYIVQFQPKRTIKWNCGTKK